MHILYTPNLDVRVPFKADTCTHKVYRVCNVLIHTDPTSFHFLLKHRYLRDSSAYIVNLTLKSRDFMVRFPVKEN
jgi:hypothetical protein